MPLACWKVQRSLRFESCLQVLRRDGTQPSLCMVLLTFATQDQADSFHHDFNGQPFSSLEPEILCR